MASSSTSLSQDRLPDWLAEALDVLTARRRLVVGVAVGLVALGALASLLAPSILPPTPIVGVAVGIAAGLLATALALALDASDLVVRGARHVRAAGGRVDVRVGRDHDDVGPLLAAVARHADDGAVRVALTPASRTAAVPGPRATALGEAIARTGRRVLLTDLTRGGSPAAGLSDVVAGERSLADVVRFEQQRYLARLAVGSDPDRAIRGFPAFAESLPSDLEVLVVALPPMAEPGVLRAAGTFDLTLVLVEVDRTERVDLIASLDAMDAAHVSSELVLIDPARRTPRPADAHPGEPDHDASAPDAAAREPAVVADPDPETPHVPEESPVPDASTAPAEVAAGSDDPVDVSTGDPADEDATSTPAPGPDDETAAALASLMRHEDVDDSALAHAELVDVDEATSDAAPADIAAADAAPADEPAADAAEEPADEPTPDEAPADETQEIPVLQGAPPAADAHAASADRPSPRDPAPAWFTAPSPADPFDEDTAFEVARTSAALQQLAQQVWQRQAR